MDTSNVPILSIIAPCYNEEEVLRDTLSTLTRLLLRMIDQNEVDSKSYICLVNDGSRDETWNIIQESQKKFLGSDGQEVIRGINLSRNFGHQSALLAGMFTLDADIYVTIDADLQDDEEAIVTMVAEWKKGNDVVYGCRSSRTTDSFCKRSTALLFYKLMEIGGAKTVYNHADFRLLSRRAVNELKNFKETTFFLRGVIPLLGFPSSKVYYARKKRLAGETKYPLKKMLEFAWLGISSFTDVPLKLSIYLGMIICVCSCLLGVWSFICWMLGDTIQGWTSLIIVFSFLGGLQIFLLGIVGSYIGKIFMGMKSRPVFIIQDNI
ncbi:MAG: glycosyltransferase family 2 protein [Akkermansia sp.]